MRDTQQRKSTKKDMPNLASTSMKQIRSENHSQANKKEQQRMQCVGEVWTGPVVLVDRPADEDEEVLPLPLRRARITLPSTDFTAMLQDTHKNVCV